MCGLYLGQVFYSYDIDQMPVEPISLSVGVIALAGLFSTCVECFDRIDAAEQFGRDYELLSTQLEVEKTRLLIWGRAVGLLETDEARRYRPDSPLVQPVIERILSCILLIFTDTEQLTSRYGAIQYGHECTKFTYNGRHGIGLISRAKFKESFEQFRSKILLNQSQTGLGQKGRWALHDRSKLTTLIDDLRQFTDGLWAVTHSPATTKERAYLTKEEIRSVRDPEILSLLVEGTVQIHTAWSDAASEALESSSLREEERRRMEDWVDGVEGDDDPTNPVTRIVSTTLGEPCDHVGNDSTYSGRMQHGHVRNDPRRFGRIGSRINLWADIPRSEVTLAELHGSNWYKNGSGL